MFACVTDLYVKDKSLIKNIIETSDVVFYNMLKLDKEHLEYNYTHNLYYADNKSKFHYVIIHYCKGKTYTYFIKDLCYN